ncbi:MAG: hypothetical protein KAI14_06015 [Dehalococcoidales bacterium]|nr:hypothetical protein [Dehalococcoidales bacterium]
MSVGYGNQVFDVLQGGRPDTLYLKQLIYSAEGPVLLPVADDVLRPDLSDAG